MDLDLEWIARAAGARRASRAELIQPLWSGYGAIYRVSLDGGARASVVVKAVRPPARTTGRREGTSDARKRRSYAVEAAWYRELSPRCADVCRMPTLLAERASGDDRTLVLEDLDAAGFDGRRRVADARELDACLAWLAALHARFLGASPTSLWPSGTYWHLATRKDELASIDDDELRAAAPILDARLRSARFQTIVHGDAKLANFCFTPSGDAVAAVDFQYAGGGPGVRDVAYLLAGSFGDEADEARRVDVYFARLREAVLAGGVQVDGPLLEAEWRALYAIACADFYRFLAGWAKDEWRRDRAAQALVARVLRTL